MSDDRTYTTASRFPKIFLIAITVTFRTPDIPELQYMIPDSNDDLKISTCLDWWKEWVQTVDCGEKAAIGARDTYWEKMKERDLPSTYERILLSAVTSPKVKLTAF